MSFKAKAQALIAWFSDLRDGIDLIAASLRTPLHRISLTAIAAESAFAAANTAHAFDTLYAAHPGLKHLVVVVGSWVAPCATVVALYTQRKGEAAALLEAKRRESGSNPALKRPPPSEE